MRIKNEKKTKKIEKNIVFLSIPIMVIYFKIAKKYLFKPNFFEKNHLSKNFYMKLIQQNDNFCKKTRKKCENISL